MDCTAGGKFEVHIYSQRVEDLDLSSVTWHRIPKLPGPHLFSFLWWFAANRVWRAWDRRFRDLRYDLVFSPGVNCLDADAISVHIVFAEYLRDHQKQLSFRANSIVGLAAASASQALLSVGQSPGATRLRTSRYQVDCQSRRTIAELEKSYGHGHAFQSFMWGSTTRHLTAHNRLAVCGETHGGYWVFG